MKTEFQESVEVYELMILEELKNQPLQSIPDILPKQKSVNYSGFPQAKV